ncbi:uncharacterized protein LOC144111479 [Amblyomma americanum]
MDLRMFKTFPARALRSDVAARSSYTCGCHPPSAGTPFTAARRWHSCCCHCSAWRPASTNTKSHISSVHCNRHLWMSLKARRLWQAHHNRHLWMSLKARKLYQAHHNRHLWMWPQCWTFSQGHLKPFNLHQNFRLCQPPQLLLGRHKGGGQQW